MSSLLGAYSDSSENESDNEKKQISSKTNDFLLPGQGLLFAPITIPD